MNFWKLKKTTYFGHISSPYTLASILLYNLQYIRHIFPCYSFVDNLRGNQEVDKFQLDILYLLIKPIHSYVDYNFNNSFWNET